MQPSPENPEQRLERFVHRALHELPSRPAPRSLEQRVLAELERRAALPWWRKSYAHWPVAAQVAFFIGSVGVIKLALIGIVYASAGFGTTPVGLAFSPLLEQLRALSDLGASLLEFGRVVLRSIPAFWLYGGLAVIAMMYAMLFGVGAFAYRTLYARR